MMYFLKNACYITSYHYFRLGLRGEVTLKCCSEVRDGWGQAKTPPDGHPEKPTPWIITLKPVAILLLCHLCLAQCNSTFPFNMKTERGAKEEEKSILESGGSGDEDDHDVGKLSVYCLIC